MASNSGQFKLIVDFPESAEENNQYIKELRSIENDTKTSIKILVLIEGSPGQLEDAQKRLSELKYSDKAEMISEQITDIQKTLLEMKNKISTAEVEISETVKGIQNMVGAIQENNPGLKPKSMDENEEDTCANESELCEFLNGEDYTNHIRNCWEDKPLHVASALGRFDLVKLFIKNGNSVNSKTRSGVTPLHRAVEKGQLSMVKYLIGIGAYIDAQTSAGETPLITAIQREHKVIVDYLCSQKASMHIIDYKCGHLTPLSYANQKKMTEIIEILKMYVS